MVSRKMSYTRINYINNKMTKLWFKELTGPENYKKKLFEFFFNTKKKMFPTDFSYQNQSHSLLIF